MKHKKSIFIFTRDLRLKDNTSLLKALKESTIVIPIFIFNPKQIDDTNKYKSNNSVQFMCECLDELNEDLNKKESRLYFFYDKPDNIIESLIKHDKYIDAVYINFDYTPFSRKRSKYIEKICNKFGVNFYEEEDYVLTGKDKVLNSNGDAYVKFTPFYNKAKKLKIQDINNSNPNNYISKRTKLPKEYTKDYHKFYDYNENILVRGGRSKALNILKKLKKFKKYNTERDYPIIPTTHLSAYLKFNVVSIREVYNKIKNKLGTHNDLLKQLYWRDFYMIVIYHNSYIIDKKMPENDDKIKWNYDRIMFNKWKDGETGYPMVDAGMRQMNTTGFMHNRCRMIVANFLIKILHIDWRWGEKYFAQKLVDYDPANNTGGWIWSASVYGIDSQPYFRIFNPMLQIKRFDENGEYIRKWIPELKTVSNIDIQEWNEVSDAYKKIKYPKPMVDYTKQKEKTIKLYK